MRPPRSLSVVAALVLAMIFSTGISQASQAAQASGPAIKLKVATFTPTRGQAPAIPRGLMVAGYAAGQRGYYLVQFSGPVEQSWKDQVTAAGAELLDYVPEFAFKVRMNPAEAQRVAQVRNVAWVDVFHPAYKLSPDLDHTGSRPLQVRVERGADAAAVAQAIGQTGATVLGREGQMLLVAASGGQADAIAQVLDVAWVQNFLLWEKHDQYARSIMGADTANAPHNSNPALAYDGSTQTVAVADTGLGGGTTTSAHPDINGRVTAVHNWSGVTDSCFQTIVNDGAQDVDSGHGTHVAGSVLSNGASSPGGAGKGVAPAAKLVFQATENWVRTSSFCKTLYGYADGYYLTGLPTDLRTLFQQAYTSGARVHANSWGSAAAGDYTANSVAADDFIWTHKDMTITFSAGNEGIDANRDGIVDNDSIGAPATAKNVITVGASENNRASYACDSGLAYTSRDTSYQSGRTCGSMGGSNLLGAYGERWASDYPAEPLKSDLTAGNQEQMAAFSSRGPTDDGRIKPDVVAPGTWILSTYSNLYQEGYDGSNGAGINPQNNGYQSDGWGMPANQYYKYFGGTSMSNPLTAGAAAVVRDYYAKQTPAVNASAALTKATLINSAVDMLDEKNNGSNTPIPNPHEGWGRVNLAAATAGSAKFVDQATGLSTGSTASYQANVTTAGRLKITLVWSDYASTDTATKNLVNDLDLEVTAPNGTVVTYRGNVFGGGSSVTGGAADRTNNVENVYVQAAAPGTWTVQIKGFNVPNGPQPFALVVDGAGTLTTVTPSTPAVPADPTLSATVVSKSQINLAWSNVANETGYKIERCTGAGCTTFAQITTVGADSTTYANTGLRANTTYTYRIRAYNAAGDSAPSNTSSATTPRK